MKYIIHIIGWGYYGGRNHKYADIFIVTAKELAKKFDTLEEAKKVEQARRAGGYEVEIEEISG